MRHIKDVNKIEVMPTTALIRGRRGALPLLAIIGLAALIGFGSYGAYQFINDDDGEAQQTLSVATPNGDKEVQISPEAKDALSCNGIASVAVNHNDINAYKAGTDPGDTLEIIERNGEPFFLQVADDATITIAPVLSHYKALAGNTAGAPLASYFAMPIEFDTICDNVPVQPRLYPASAPTLTVVNDNGITGNSDSNHETADASSTYSPCMTVKAPSEACSSKYGALVGFEYDVTYVNKVDSTDLKASGFDAKFQVAHTTNHSATGLDMDGYTVMMFDKELYSGQKAEICFDVTTTASAPGEDQANVQIHWYPLNYDLDADKYTIIGPAIYDEDNNLISQGNTTAIYYTA